MCALASHIGESRGLQEVVLAGFWALGSEYLSHRRLWVRVLLKSQNLESLTCITEKSLPALPASQGRNPFLDLSGSSALWL